MGEPKDLRSLFKDFLEDVEPKLRTLVEQIPKPPFDPGVAAVDVEAARARLRPYWGSPLPEKPDVIDFALQVIEYQNRAAIDWRGKFEQVQKDCKRAIAERDAARVERDQAREVRADQVRVAGQDMETIHELDQIIDSFKFSENAVGDPPTNKLFKLRDEYNRMLGLVAHIHSVTRNAPTRPLADGEKDTGQ